MCTAVFAALGQLFMEIAGRDQLVLYLRDLGKARGGVQGCLDALKVTDVCRAVFLLDSEELLRATGESIAALQARGLAFVTGSRMLEGAAGGIGTVIEP